MEKLFDNYDEIIKMYEAKIPYKIIIEHLNLNINRSKLYRWIKEFKHLKDININNLYDLKIYLKSHYVNNRGRINIIKLKKNLYILNKIDIIVKSKYNLNLNEKLHYILYDKNDSDILCKNCKKEKALFDTINRGFKKVCSKKCSDSFSDRINKIKSTKKVKYGYETWNMDKVRKTIKEKYGVENVSQNRDVRKKIDKTVKNKYGVNNVMQSHIIKERIKKTNRERYKCNNAIQNSEIKLKTKSNNNEKYGVDYPVQQHINNYEEWIDNNRFIKVYNKLESVEDISNYFNIRSLSTIYQRARKLNLLYKPNRREVTIKKIGKTIESLSYNIEYNNRTIIKPLELDIVIRKDNKIVKTLEYNGLMFHSLGISEHKVFNNWNKYRNSILEFINRDKVKLNKCRELNIELLILREDIYLNNPNIIDMWLNGKLKYNVLEEPVIYRFKSVNKLETIQYRVCNNNYTNSHCRRPNKVLSSRVLREIEDSIENGYRIYFDWIKVDF